MDLTNLESTILRFLEAHQGKDFAISRKDLVEKINSAAVLQCCDSAVNGNTATQQHSNTLIHERKIRETIKHLTTQHGYAIGSCHSGYFMAITAEEIEGVCKYYDSYVHNMAFVSSRLKKIGIREYYGQMSMKFGG